AGGMRAAAPPPLAPAPGPFLPALTRRGCRLVRLCGLRLALVRPGRVRLRLILRPRRRGRMGLVVPERRTGFIVFGQAEDVVGVGPQIPLAVRGRGVLAGAVGQL